VTIASSATTSATMESVAGCSVSNPAAGMRKRTPGLCGMAASGPNRAKVPKASVNISPRASHCWRPNRAMPTNVSAE
jgi:hypothetical protein